MIKDCCLFIFIFFMVFCGCHVNYIKRIDISDKEPYKDLIDKEFVLKKDSYVFSITHGKTILISNCGNRSWIGPAISRIDPNLIGKSLNGDMKILHFYTKGTTFSIAKIYNEITRLGSGGPTKDKVVMISIGEYKIVGVDHSWINQTVLDPNIMEIFYSEYAVLKTVGTGTTLNNKMNSDVDTMKDNWNSGDTILN